MNNLFINYGDPFANIRNHITAFAGELEPLGHACVIALSSTPLEPARDQLSHAELLAHPRCFPDGRPADIVHAWPPRPAHPATRP